MNNIDICYHDDDLLIVNKPAGLLCVPGLSTPDNLYDRILKKFPEARTVHRLDMATSGLIIFALNHPIQKAMGKLFEQRKINKSYLADIDGELIHEFGEIQLPLLCDWENRPKQRVDWENGKKGITFFQKLTFNAMSNTTRIKLIPHTGRSHQLRVHMLSIGHPIIGDEFYHTNNSNKKSTRLHLHATELNFIHPLTDNLIQIMCEPSF